MDCQDFTQQVLTLMKDSEQEDQVTLNKNFIRCYNSSLQLLHSNFVLSSVLAMDHLVRKYRKKYPEASSSLQVSC